MKFGGSNMKATRPERFFLKAVLLLFGLTLANAAASDDVFCFNAGAKSGWDCDQSSEADAALESEYHTLKVVLGKQQDGALLDEVLPIERIAQLPLPTGETVIFLGRFRDSMKAFRVVEKCQQLHASQCAQFAPKVIKIGGDTDEPDKPRDQEVRVAALDLQAKAPGDLVRGRETPLDISKETVGAAINSAIGANVPKGLIKLPETLKHVLWVDLKEGNLHILQQQNGKFQLVRTMSISIGKNGFGKMQRGDKKTPVGVYRLLSYLPDERLDEFYGNGAYTLNYPNALDQIKNRDGSGIWLHGLPKGKDHRPLQDSDGCVVLSNTMIDDIGRYIDFEHTPIVLDDRLEWVAGDEIESRRRELEQAIESWRQAWAGKDNDRYLAFYANDFTNLEKDLAAWKRYKTRVNGSKTFIKVKVSDLNLLGYPGEKDMVLARFYQRYDSSNFRAAGWKEQLWRKEDSGQWRIVYERG